MPENKKHKDKGRDYSEILIWSAALVTVVRYAAAFIASDATKIGETLSLLITYAMGFSGLGMGILDVIGGTYLFTGWQKKMPKNGDPWSFKFKVLTFFAIGLIVNGILILIPFTMSRVSGVSIHHVLGDGVLLFGWSAVVNVAPYLLIGGVAVGNLMVTIDQPKGEQGANGSPNVRQEEEQGANSSRTFSSLTNIEKSYIMQTDSKVAAKKIGVTQRAIQKWRLKIQEESTNEKIVI